MSGIKGKWSNEKKGMTWGFDITVDGSRRRGTGHPTQEAALAAASLLTTKFGSIGAAAELWVCADLLRQGYDVFRSVASNAACDLIVSTQDGRLCRVEVKSAISRRGGVEFKRHRFDKSKHDVLALVFLRENRMLYTPSVPDWFDQNGTKGALNLIESDITQ